MNHYEEWLRNKLPGLRAGRHLSWAESLEGCADEIARLHALVEEAYREGFNAGETYATAGYYPSKDLLPDARWADSDARADRDGLDT